MTTALYKNSSHLVQVEALAEEQVQGLLAPAGFADWKSAYQLLQRIASYSPQARQALAEGLPALLIALAGTVNPDRVLVYFERFVQSAADPTVLLQNLGDNPRGFEKLVTLFTGSQFLTEILLRHPHYFEQLADHKQLAHPKDLATLRQEIEGIIRPFFSAGETDITPALDALRRFQRHELLRIGTCDLLGLLDLPTVTTQLSHLADSLAQACLDLAGHYTQTNPQGFTVLAMGKLGGREVNYSSDIDLIFLAGAEAHRYHRLGQQLIDALARVTAEGFLYRVDMRLRPWGRSGALVNSVEAHIIYLQKHAGLWERQALLKARPIAGDMTVGQEFLDRARPIIFGTGGELARAEIHKLKQRIEAQLHQQGRGWGEVKLGQGSIRDIEFITQYLQLTHGRQNPALNTPNTLEALAHLSAARLVAGDEYRVLADGYIFLRTVEHHLQLMHYRQTHTLPSESQALDHLARRLGFQGVAAGDRFKARYQQHSAVIRAIYQRYLGLEDNQSGNEETPQSNLLPLLARMPSAYVITFSEADIAYHARLLDKLDGALVNVEALPLANGLWQVTIVGYDYLGALSLICGLMFVHGFNIIDGHVFTYDSAPNSETLAPTRRSRSHRRYSSQPKPSHPRQKIVDVFTVRSVKEETGSPSIWQAYAADLAALFQRLQKGEQREAQGGLVKRVATALTELGNASGKLYPVEVEIDNEAAEGHTVLRIDAPDTTGFLYTLTNSLALIDINIRRMTVASAGNRVQDVLYVTDSLGSKITSPEKQRELRIATVLIKQFTHLLPHSPNPEAALLNFREFVGQLFTRPDWPNELASLERPEVLDRLARLLGVSDFLWKDFLRMQHANLFPLVRDVKALAHAKSKAELREELALLLQATPWGDARRTALNDFKDREMFRIDMRQIQGYASEFGQFSAELTDLVEVVISSAYHLAGEELRPHFGLPRLANGRECGVSVCGLGKFGGREMGYASDIELMFIFAGSGHTTGPRVLTTPEFFTRLVQEVTQIVQAKQEGIFEIDLRLRPYGKAGGMAVPIEGFRQYFGPGGEAWPYERQALVKLRPIAGDFKLGQEIVKLRDALIYSGEPFDVTAMRAMRERQLRHLVTAGAINAKFSPGGLVDVEYLVQGLQITHGHLDSSFRHPNTYEAMKALAMANIIPAEDYPHLLEATIFLRKLINALRMVRGNARDLTVPPPHHEEFAFLARRLHYGDDHARLQADITRHTTYVQELSLKLLG